MFCSNCGFKINEDAKFCPSCGQAVNANSVKTIKLKCQECGGVMDVDNDNQILYCQYCGSKNLLPESDDVKIERIRSKTELTKEQIHKDVKLAEQEHERNMEKMSVKVGIGMMIWLFVVAGVLWFFF